MLFNSIQFAIFLIILFVLYWFVTIKNLKAQNILLLVASYVFYGWWDWRFLGLLALLSITNYFIGIGIEINETIKKRKAIFVTGLIVNIGVLGVFKYYNFFIDNFIDLVSLIGYNLPRSTTKIILPVGISFYVFLSLSYIIDIYKKNLNANRNVIEVLLALSFFPIILAGPIQRPASLLPQIIQRREFNYDRAIDGLRQILWGVFAKVIIADNFAGYVNEFFVNYSNYSGSTLLLGAVFYTFQIYADFSGYSNMAIGTAKLFGFNLMRNFAHPYFSRNITEFWKRWHISLVTWFRDYVFLPLSFSVAWKIKSDKILFIRTDLFIYIIASIIVWFLTGLWHGANYTFIIWGMIHGVLLILYKIAVKPRKRFLYKLRIKDKNNTLVFVETIITFFIVMIAWIFFRAENIGHAISYISEIFSPSTLTIPQFVGRRRSLPLIILLTFFVLIEWMGRERQYAIEKISGNRYRLLRWNIYVALILCILIWGSFEKNQFIYFQF